MKSQNDLIVTIVAILVALIAGAVSFFTKRPAETPPAPEQVVTTAPALPTSAIKMANTLPNAAQNSGGPGGGAIGRPAAGPGGSAPAGPGPGDVPMRAGVQQG